MAPTTTAEAAHPSASFFFDFRSSAGVTISGISEITAIGKRALISFSVCEPIIQKLKSTRHDNAQNKTDQPDRFRRI